MRTGSAEAVPASSREAGGEKRRNRPVRLETWIRVWRTFRPLARRHARLFWQSNLAAAFVVGSRLLFPWPLKALLKPWLKEGALLPGVQSTVSLDQEWFRQALFYGGAFLLIVLVFGYADYRQRVLVARFAIGWVRDIRAEAFRAAYRLGSRGRAIRSGDVVSRLVGDTARLKAGLKGFLVHVATNGMLFLGITVVLVCVSPRLAAIQALGWLGVLVVTWIGARRVYRRSLDYRRKEGKIADRIQEAVLRNPREMAFSKVNYSSGHHEAALATIQGRVTFAAHVILGLSTVLAVAAGIAGLRSGSTDIDALFVFVLYARTMHKPGVRLARQGSRLGKVVACAERLEKLIRSAEKQSRKVTEVAPLRKALVLDGATVLRGGDGEGRPCLGPVDLRIPAGQHLLVTGGAGSGKSTLVELLAGRLRPMAGKVLFDGTKMHRIERENLTRHVACAGSQPSWIRKPLGQILGLDAGDSGAAVLAAWRRAGFLAFVDALPEGLDTRLGVHELSAREAREVDILRVLASGSSLLLLDEPFAALDEDVARRLAAMLAELRGTTVVVTSARPVYVESFDRLLRLEAGRLAEDRPPGRGQTEAGRS